MKKSWIIIGIIVIVVVILYSWFKGTYNEMVTKSESVNGAWAQVENVYQRRADLIPNLVETVKGYAAHEKETLEGVIEARSKATSVNIDANQLTPETFQAFQQAQEGLTQALSKLMVVVERYPDLKANQNFLELQAQLEGTENRINVARQDYNKAVESYNLSVKRFPKSILASMFRFGEKAYYKADAGTDKAPDIKFDIK